MSDPSTKDMMLMASLPAISVNRAYIAVIGDMGRMTFIEAFGDDVEAPRVAVSMSTETLLIIRDAITETLRIHAAQSAPERHVSLN